MLTTYRNWYRYGQEDDYVELTIKEFPSVEKAIAYAERYAKGIRFCGVEVRNKDNEIVYEITSDMEVYDYR